MNEKIILHECTVEYFANRLRELQQEDVDCSVEITRGSEAFAMWEGMVSDIVVDQVSEGSVLAFTVGTVSFELDDWEHMFCCHQSESQTMLCAGIPSEEDGASPYTIWINASH